MHCGICHSMDGAVQCRPDFLQRGDIRKADPGNPVPGLKGAIGEWRIWLMAAG